MGYSIAYTNGVIAVKETRLLGEKILRLLEMTEREALSALAESGFSVGGGDVTEEEERALDDFIREYAPTKEDKAYFLVPRDFHNLKALYKAELLQKDPALMLAPEGIWSRKELNQILEEKRPPLPKIEEGASGAKVGAAFDRAMYAYLLKTCKRRADLTRLLRARIDMTNILTAHRVPDMDALEAFFLDGGTLKIERISKLFSPDKEERESALKGTPYEKFCAACAHEKGKPFTAAERMLASFEAEFYLDSRYVLEGRDPFLYYVFRRRAEIANVRTILLCLRAGVPAEEIQKRLAGVR